MMHADRLPTPAEMLTRAEAQLDNAYRALSDAGDELRSDWPPGYEMSEAQAVRRIRMFRAIDEAKAAINRGKS